MIVTRILKNLPYDRLSGGSTVTIGSYDGLHVGHMKLLDEVVERARTLGVPAVVMSFEPTPKEFFSADSPPARLMSFREKYEALRDCGVDLLFCPRFDASMRDTAVDTFIRRLLIHALNVKALVVGDDFRFAKNRAGGITELRRAGEAVGFDVKQVSSVVHDNERVSSGAIRRALAGGDLRRAEALLGKPYRMSGTVIEGHKMGRQLGFPTANFHLNRKKSAVMGIFAARVSGVADCPLDAVVSVGTRPTFAGTHTLIEAHLFDFDGDLYGKRIHVDFVQKLRDELKFDSAADLVDQMNVDAEEARSILVQRFGNSLSREIM